MAPKFQARHYQDVAEAVKRAASLGTSNDHAEMVDAVIMELGYVFQNDNPRFDFDRFSEAVKGSAS